MIYSVVFKGTTLKQLNKLPKADKARVNAAIELLKLNPIPPAAKKLRDRPGYRIRVGNYRIIYHFEKTEIQILILKISHRKNAYQFN